MFLLMWSVSVYLYWCHFIKLLFSFLFLSPSPYSLQYQSHELPLWLHLDEHVRPWDLLRMLLQVYQNHTLIKQKKCTSYCILKRKRKKSIPFTGSFLSFSFLLFSFSLKKKTILTGKQRKNYTSAEFCSFSSYGVILLVMLVMLDFRLITHLKMCLITF